jgi:hypothetical protein
MRKVDPDDVRGDFHAEVTDLIDYFGRMSAATANSAHAQGDVSRLAETTFLSAYVAFERFLSDLFLAYLNRQFTGYGTDLESRIRQSVHERYGQWAAAQVRLNTVRHVRLADLEPIVNREGRNLTFSSAQDIRDKAQRWLAAPYHTRIASLNAADDRLIDTARAIRNFMSHQSRSAKADMNQHLATVAQGNHNRHLGRGAHQVHAVGSFLKAVFNGQRRVVGYATRLRDISSRM